jgi:hypothetical protein
MKHPTPGDLEHREATRAVVGRLYRARQFDLWTWRGISLLAWAALLASVGFGSVV